MSSGNARDLARNLRTTLRVALRRTPRRRIVAVLLAVVIFVALTFAVPLPTALQLRDWATAVGPWFPLAFFGAHVLVTVFPFPRTAFSLAAGLLFGTAMGVAIAVIASTASAVIALLLIRAVGWKLERVSGQPHLTTLDARLRHRGWPAVLSLRLIPVVPFAPLNYAAGASAVRVWPYTVATVLGLLPGTLAVVILGDALTGRVNPLLVGVSALTAAIGTVGVVHEVRLHRREHRVAADCEPVAAPRA